MNKKQKIIAIHGAGMNAGMFGGVGMFLTDMAFVPVTLPGHSVGLSGALLQDIPAMAAWLAARLEADAPKSVILVGHSMGGLIALAASAHPAVAGVCVMGCAEKMPVHPDLLDMAKSNPSAAIGLVAKWGVDPTSSEMKQAALDIMARTPENCLYADLFACDSAPPAAIAPDVPFLALVGEQDKMVKTQACVDLAEKCAGSFVLLENCGHMMPLEKAAECAREIRDFAADIAVR